VGDCKCTGLRGCSSLLCAKCCTGLTIARVLPPRHGRLTVGWLWEIVVQDAFNLLGGTSSLQPYQAVLVEILFATVVIAIILGVHLIVRDWASDALTAEDARTLNANTTQPLPGSGAGEDVRRVDSSLGHNSTITI
jgi:hypothetical protein